ncbi:env [Simian immunodeficiency virus]|uniref:Envelope glycoprotein gp160 n=1 Tax=Simian immunodeficiency virus TaxID=11723 RepID=A0A075T524_SIV|nr:env [Simian immunodeficiency virus]
MTKYKLIVLGIAIIIGLITIDLQQGDENDGWVTVFYGVPVWHNATPPLFCTADARHTWVTTNCLPTDPAPIETPMNISGEWFNVHTNYMVDHMDKDMAALFLQATKPCTKLTPMCVKMKCQNYTKEATTTTTPTSSTTSKAPPTTTQRPATEWWGGKDPQSLLNCTFNMTPGFKDRKAHYWAPFYTLDLWQQSNGTNGTGEYYVKYCNTSAMTQACDKFHFQPFPVHYCPPAGYALFKCNDIPWNGQGPCKNVTAVHCTHAINTLASTWLQLNGTYEKNTDEVQVMRKYNSNYSVAFIFSESQIVNLTCVRPGNKSIRNLQIGAGMTFYSQLIVGGNTRRAYCKINGTQWYNALNATYRAIKKEYNLTRDQPITWRSQPRGDREVESHWFQCQGEFFYCNLSRIFQKTNFTNDTFYPRNITKEGAELSNIWFTCTIRQVVNRWSHVEKLMYLPPRRGHVQCTSNVTGILVESEYYPGSPFNMTPSANIKDLWKIDLRRYKVVEIDPIGLAPTPIKRYEPPPSKSVVKRAAALTLGFLGFLSTAGATMGSVATALTVQSRSLLEGIVAQQKALLEAVEHQQQLLQLSVWGIRNLNARLTAIEKYVKDQGILASYGCQFKQICYTSVPWNKSFADGALPAWHNMTWIEWERKVTNHTGIINTLLVEAQRRQEENTHKLQKLGEWDNLWNWFDISKWFQWIKIAVLIVIGLIALRIVMWLINILKMVRAGYLPLAQTPFHQPQVPGRRGETDEEGGDGDNVRSVRLLNGFLAVVWDDLRAIVLWIYRTLVNLGWLIRHLWNGLTDWWFGRAYPRLILAAEATAEATRRAVAYIHYGLQEFKAAVISAWDALAIFTWNWTEAVLAYLRRLAQGIIAIPRRIRQGAEILLN